MNRAICFAVVLLFVSLRPELKSQGPPASAKSPSAQRSFELQHPPTAELAEICTFRPNKIPQCWDAHIAEPPGKFDSDDGSKHVAQAPAVETSKCAWLLPDDADSGPGSPPDSISMPDATTIANLLGSPYPFAAIAPDKSTLLIYRISPGSRDVSPDALKRLNLEIRSLFFGVGASASPKPFQAEFSVPHQAALGDLAAQLQSLNPDFTIQDVGKQMVRVTVSSGEPDCKKWETFIDDLHSIVWSMRPDSPVAHVFFNAATDVSNALNGTNAPGSPIVLTGNSGGGSSPGGASGGSPSGSSSSGGGGGASGGGTGSSSSASATPASSPGAGSGAGGGASSGSSSTSASSTTNGGATVSISQSPGTSTTLSMVSKLPSVASGLPTVGSNAGAAKPGGTGAAGPASGASQAPAAGSTAPAKPTLTQAALGSNDVIFSDVTNGDDAAITERKRIIAAVDLPRPEMMINTWILQQSTSDSKLSENVIDDVRRTVAEQNESLQTAIFAGWKYLYKEMATPKTYFNLPFYNYVVPRVMFNPSAYAPPPAPLTRGEIVSRALRDQDVLRAKGPGIFYDSSQYEHENSTPFNYCPDDRYCLGYTTIFQPLQPNLTTLMLALIAAKNPTGQASAAIDEAEQHQYWQVAKTCPECSNISPHLDGFKKNREAKSDGAGQGNKTGGLDGNGNATPTPSESPDSDWAKLIQSVLYSQGFRFNRGANLEDDWLRQETDCGRADQKASLWFLYHHGERPVFFLECFRRAFQLAQEEITPCPCPPGQTPPATCPPSTEPDKDKSERSPILGQARAAIADFLYHYKMSVQYPHEFTPYDLTRSAEEMNKAVRPFIDAFNRDLAAYQQISQYLLNAKTTDNSRKEWFGGGKGRFNYNALVSVHTISGSEAIVDTTTESYLDTLNMPTLAGLLGSLNNALPEASSSGGGGNGATTTTSSSTTNGTTTTTSSTTQPVVPTSKPAKAQGVLSNLSLNQAQVLAGAIGAFQPSHAHIGRQTTVDVLPESLSGASSAELQVALHSADGASPPSFAFSAPGGPSDPEVSRFSNSSISTRIRVDSVKMFEVASFSAELVNSRKNIPIAPIPLVQLPYVSSVFSIPLHPAREFHSSIAVMSAVIIPTATDLASGIRFVSDRLVEPPPLSQKLGCYWPPFGGQLPSPAYPHLCKLRPAIALADFADQPIREFHRKMIYCLSTGMSAAESNLLDHKDATGLDECSNLTFREVPADAN
jgi:hypothetical protein